MEIPSPVAGVVKELKLKIGDKVSEGTLIMLLEAAERAGAAAAPQRRRPPRSPRPAAAKAAPHAAADCPTQRRQLRPPRGPAPICTPRSWCWARARAAIPRPFARRTSGKNVVLIERHADARRGLPQRRLHSVQGAAACGQGGDGGRGDGARAASYSASRRSTSTSCAAGRTRWSAKPDQGPGCPWPSSAR